MHRRRPVAPLLTPAGGSDGPPRGPDGGEGGSDRGGEGSGAGVGGLADPVTGLHPVHHGREILSCALLPPFRGGVAKRSPSSSQSASTDPTPRNPSSSSVPKSSLVAPTAASGGDAQSAEQHIPGSSAGHIEPQPEGVTQSASPLCLLTGSEDGTMRQLLYSPQAADSRQHSLSNSRHDQSNGGEGQSFGSQTESSCGQTQLDNEQSRPDNRQGQPVDGQTTPSSGQGQAVDGQSGPSSGQGQAVDGQSGQLLPGNGQHASAAGSSGNPGCSSGHPLAGSLQEHIAAGSHQPPRGFFGSDEVGFQAAGSAVKSIVAIPTGLGKGHISGISYTMFFLYCHPCASDISYNPDCKAISQICLMLLVSSSSVLLYVSPCIPDLMTATAHPRASLHLLF